MDIIESNQKQADTCKIIAVVKLNFFFQVKDSVNTAFLLAIIKYRRDHDLTNAVDSVQINVSHHSLNNEYSV
jgi:hypothetical protein